MDISSGNSVRPEGEPLKEPGIAQQGSDPGSGGSITSGMGTSAEAIVERYKQAEHVKPALVYRSSKEGPHILGLRISSDNKVSSCAANEAVVAPNDGSTIWIDVETPTKAVLQELMVRFKLHPKSIDDCLNFDQITRVENHIDHLFIVTNVFGQQAKPGVSSNEIHTFVGKNFIITVHDRKVEALKEVWRELRSNEATFLGNASPTAIFCSLSESIIDADMVVLEEKIARIDQLSHQLHFGDLTVEGMQPVLQELTNSTFEMRRVLEPYERIYNALKRKADPATEPTLNRLHDEILNATQRFNKLEQKINDLKTDIDRKTQVELARSAEQSALAANRMTVILLISCPLTIATGIFGMNFTSIPFDSKLLLWGGMAVSVAASAALGYLAHKKKWI